MLIDAADKHLAFGRPTRRNAVSNGKVNKIRLSLYNLSLFYQQIHHYEFAINIIYMCENLYLFGTCVSENMLYNAHKYTLRDKFKIKQYKLALK